MSQSLVHAQQNQGMSGDAPRSSICVPALILRAMPCSLLLRQVLAIHGARLEAQCAHQRHRGLRGDHDLQRQDQQIIRQ
jgi:hypothetical protein